MTDTLISVSEASRRLGLSPELVKRLIKNGTLKAIDANPSGKNRSFYIPSSEIERLKSKTDNLA